MIATASNHLHDLVQQIEQLKAQSGVQRVADFLASLVSAESGCCNVPLPYEKTLIAGQLGLKPESLSRTFACANTCFCRVGPGNFTPSLSQNRT